MATWEVINRSDWPLWALKPICFWIMKEAKLVNDYRIIFKKSGIGFAGRGGKFESRIRCSRAAWSKTKWPFTFTDYYKDSFEAHSRLDILIDLVAHEIYHAVTLRGSFRGIWAERECNDFAGIIRRDFRANWKNYWFPKLRETYRREYYNNKAPTVEEKLTSNIEHERKLLSRWESKAQRAQRKIKKYKAALRRYEVKLAALKIGK